MERHFFLGTTNRNKIREISSILSLSGFTCEPTDPIDPEETEKDFEGNALLKAKAYARHAGGTTISEDSGLIIPALGGLPGPWSARFSEFDVVRREEGVVEGYVPSSLPREEIDAQNNNRVLALMKDIEQPFRGALFKVVLVVADKNGKVLFKAVGESHGWVATEARGTNGFGYDPIFVGNDTFGKTYAELDSVRKNLRSHRRHVLQELQSWLASQLTEHQRC